MTSVGVVSLFSVAHMARTTFEKERAVALLRSTATLGGL